MLTAQPATISLTSPPFPPLPLMEITVYIPGHLGKNLPGSVSQFSKASSQGFKRKSQLWHFLQRKSEVSSCGFMILADVSEGLQVHHSVFIAPF